MPVTAKRDNKTMITIEYVDDKPIGPRDLYIATLTNEINSNYRVLELFINTSSESTEVDWETPYCLTVYLYIDGMISPSYTSIHIPGKISMYSLVPGPIVIAKGMHAVRNKCSHTALLTCIIIMYIRTTNWLGRSFKYYTL